MAADELAGGYMHTELLTQVRTAFLLGLAATLLRYVSDMLERNGSRGPTLVAKM